MWKAFRKSDILLIICLLLAAVLLLLLVHVQSEACVAIVEKNGEKFCEIDLSRMTEPKEIAVGGPYDVRLLAEPGAISFLHSSCPDGVCVRTGRLTKAGQAAVCLPARVSVRLSGRAASDAVTG